MTSTSVDEELEKIRNGIANVHRTLYKLTRQVETVGGKVDATLTDFDVAVGEVRDDVNDAKVDILEGAQKFPRSWEYLTLNFIVELAIWLFAVFLIYKIIQQVKILRRAREEEETSPPVYTPSKTAQYQYYNPPPPQQEVAPYAVVKRLPQEIQQQQERSALLAISEPSSII